MTGHQPTVDFIRQIMADGIVTEDEVISLATHLNDDREARKSWPGIAVFEVLKDVFSDGTVDTYEIEGLAKILQGIEIICAGGFTGDTSITQVTPAAPSELTDFHLPVLDQIITISPTSQFDTEHRVDLKRHLCDCKDWMQNRAHLEEHSPGRMCKHLVKGLDRAAEANPAFRKTVDPLLLDLAKASAGTDRGLEAVPNWRRLLKGDIEFLIAWGVNTEWCNVFAANAEGKAERYAYHLANKRWSFGARPAKSGLLKEFLEKNF
ncbi:MAG: hypothetical protein ISQ14_07070 [Verrucomicrobiae bacterium]|jgi:hypothetical protein|nr:hypothetical protein [Verrucomicrobiae bacterium]